MATIRPVLVIRGNKRLFGTSRENQVNNSRTAGRSVLLSRSAVDFPTDPEGSLTNLGIWPQISENSRINLIPGQNNRIIAHSRLPGLLPRHEGWKDNKGICRPYKEAPALEFQDGRFARGNFMFQMNFLLFRQCLVIKFLRGCRQLILKSLEAAVWMF